MLSVCVPNRSKDSVTRMPNRNLGRQVIDFYTKNKVAKAKLGGWMHSGPPFLYWPMLCFSDFTD